jgi:ATP-dependent protease ClpP protease subunit
MASWSEILDRVQTYQDKIGQLNKVRQESIEKVAELTGRNVITYYSGWLKDADLPNTEVNEMDMNALMNAVYKLDKSKGLDLILHTPGGNIAVTESIVNYLKNTFKGDVRAIVPQLSMSCGTMIAISCKEIIMGRHSSLGPIDPQYMGVACQSVVEEFERAVSDVTKNPNSLGLWQTVISKYPPTFLKECENAIEWSKKLAEQWLSEVNTAVDLDKFNEKFISHSNSYSHSRHISKEDCKEVGLKITDLEDNPALQDAVLSLHHCYMILFDQWKYSKVVENHLGSHFLQSYN